MIPNEAVEAAMHAIARNYGTAGTPANTVLWERVAIDARAALEAAAPHLMAAAWDEGYRECYERQMYEPMPVNPYRKAPDA